MPADKKGGTMGKRIFAPVVLLAAGLVLVATSVGAQATKPSGTPIKIGGSLPLTGIYSETGKLIKEATTSGSTT